AGPRAACSPARVSRRSGRPAARSRGGVLVALRLLRSTARMSEDEAFRRIAAARLARRFPLVLDMVERGRRCPARAFLELDHATPRALGGAGDATNISVRCRGHNGLAAERVFGRAHVENKKKAEKKNHPRQRVYDAAKAACALRGLGFKQADVRRALAQV